MHFLSRITTGIALMAAFSSAMAESSVDILVTGTITPGGCTPTLSNAQLQHNKIAARDLSTGQRTGFNNTERQITLMINCDAAVVYGISAIDNRADSVIEGLQGTYFGLGRTSAGEKIGAHMLRIDPARSTIDGKPAFVTVGHPDRTRWLPAQGDARSVRNNGVLIGLAETAGVTTGPVPIKNAVLALTSSLVIEPAETLTLTSEVTLDGAATLELIYL